MEDLVLKREWFPITSCNTDYDFWSDRLEIEIEFCEGSDGRYGRPLQYCWSGRNGPRTYSATDARGAIHPEIIEDITSDFLAENISHLAEAPAPDLGRALSAMDEQRSDFQQMVL